MAPFTSNVWSPGESSLKRSSFNALVQGRQADVPEIMMRAQSMGRQAEFGPGWTPSSIVARKLSESAMEGSSVVSPAWQSVGQRQHPQSISMTRRQRSSPAVPSSPKRGFFRDPAADSAAMGGSRALRDFLRKESGSPCGADGDIGLRDQPPPAMISRFKPVLLGPPKMAWGTMLPQKDIGGRQASAPLLQASSQSTSASAQQTPRSNEPGYATFQSTMRSSGSGARPGSAPDGQTLKPRGHKSTTAWRTNEMSLGRDSLNAIVRGSKLDVPEAMMRQTSMGRQAEMGPDWVPSGLLARQMSSMMTGFDK